MKKIYPFAAYALATAVTAFGSGTVLAQYTDDNANTGSQSQTTGSQSQSQSTPRDMDTMHSTPKTTANDQSTQIPKHTDKSTVKQSGSITGADHATMANHPRVPSRGYMDSVPENGMQASDLIGSEIKTTTGDEVVGTVDDLIIDEDGQVVAIVVGVDGYQGMSEKDVAIGWDDVTRSVATDDEQELRISVARETLRPAPEYARQD